MKPYSKHIFVCEMGGNCSSRGSEGMRDMLRDILDSRGIAEQVRITKTACVGACGFGPNVVIYPDGIWYYGVQEKDLARIIDETVVGGRTIDDLLFHKYGDPTVVEVVRDPICGTIFRVNQAAGSEKTSERTVYFCCEGCRQSYLADPGAYAQSHGHHGAHAGHQAAPAGHASHHGHQPRS